MGQEKLTMSKTVAERAEMFPYEIRVAVDAFAGERQQALLATLLEEGPLSFSELQSAMGGPEKDEEMHQYTLSQALDPLQEAGLITKRSNDGTVSDRYDAYYEVTEYGSRFVHCLLESLGSVDSFERSEPAVEPLAHYRNEETGESPQIEQYRRRSGTTRESTDSRSI